VTKRFVFLPALLMLGIFGCGEKEDTFERLPIVAPDYIQSWQGRRWVLVATGSELEKNGDRTIVDYNPLVRKHRSFVRDDGVVTSIGVGGSLAKFAFAHWEGEPYQPVRLELFAYERRGFVSVYESRPGEVIHSLSWSPCERYLAFLVGPNSDEDSMWRRQQLCIMEVASRKIRRVATLDCYGSRGIICNAQLYDCRLLWSGDSRNLFYSSARGDLLRLNLATGASARIGRGCVPVMADQGKVLVLEEKPFRLVEVKVKGGQPRVLFSMKGVAGFGGCIVSPDGRVIGINCTQRGIVVPQLVVYDRERGILGVIPSFRPVLGWCRDADNAPDRR
jgi:hypothetical protein